MQLSCKNLYFEKWIELFFFFVVEHVQFGDFLIDAAEYHVLLQMKHSK